MSDLVLIQQEIEKEFANKEVVTALVQTAFKGLTPEKAKQAALEGMIRGYKFKDFLEGNVYAIPYGQGYSLVSGIDHARKIGMRSGVIGKGAPEYETDSDGKLISCTVTIKRRVGEDVGEFTATVYFEEYSTGQNLWTKKPRTMIAKVAEMHALRMACPEELAQAYVEEELERHDEKVAAPLVDIEACRAKLAATKNLEDLKTVWAGLPIDAKNQLVSVKESLKNHFEKQDANPQV